MSNLEERLSKIAARMTMHEPFIASVFTKLDRRVLGADDAHPVTTAGTNGSVFFFRESFCDALEDDELFGLALHEALHVVFMHMWRRGGRHPAIWNVANDAIINRIIANKKYRLPKGGVDISWVQEDMDSELVYNRLMQEAPPSSGGSGQGSGSGEGEDDPRGKGGFDGQGDLMDAESDADRVDMEATIMAAAKMAKTCGDKSAYLDRLLGGDLQPLVNWADELRAMMTSTAKDDFSYRRVNRRLLHQGVYLPTLFSEALGGIVVAVDTSGSVGSAELERIAAEIRGVVESANPEFVEVVYCDSAVAGTQRFNRGEALTLKAKGGGGTAFKPVFDYVAKMGEPIAALIYLTDMCGDLNFGPPPDYPVIWGNIYGYMGSNIPFGKELRIYA